MTSFVDGRTVGFGVSQESRDKSSPWYKKEIGGIPDESRELLEKYAGILPDEVEQHVYAMVKIFR